MGVYTFENYIGTGGVQDVWANARNFTLTGGAGIPLLFPGKNGNAINYTNITDFHSAAVNYAFDESTNFSVSLWVYPRSSATVNYVIYFHSTGQFDSQIGIDVPNNRTYFGSGKAGVAAWYAYSTGVNLNSWNHLVAIWNGTCSYLWWNNVSQGCSGQYDLGDISTNTQTTFSYNDANFYRGGLDEVYIYNRTLTANDVYDLYSSFYTELSTPTLNTNATIPSIINHTSTGNYINITASDSDNDDIIGAYFNLTAPNGTLMQNMVNGSYIRGNSVIGINEEWHSANFSMPQNSTIIGQWNWTVLLVSNASTRANQSYSYWFNVSDSTKPNITINSPGIATNPSFLLNITVPDIVSYCFFNITKGASIEIANTTLSQFGSTDFFNISVVLSGDGTYNLWIWCNDSSNNWNQTNLSFTASTSVSPGGGGGGGVRIIEVLQNITTSTICLESTTTFNQAYSQWRINIFDWPKFKVMWFALWNNSNCVSSASLVPF
jgi:hypothetical protein